MKTEVKKIDQHKRALSVEIQGDIVKQKFNLVYKRINKEARVPGFRAGNVPRDILEKHYSGLAYQEALKELLPEVYNQALKENDLEPISHPQISEVNLDKDRLSFNAKFEVRPEINLGNYKNLKVEYGPIQVNEGEMKEAFDRIKKNYAQISDDECARSLGYPNQAVLGEVLERQIYLEKARLQQINLENSLIEQLLKQTDFQVPSSLVNRQLEDLVKQAELDMTLRGLSKEDIEKQRPTLRESLLPQAERQVRIFLVLEEVARRENIIRSEKMSKDVIEFLLRQADWKGGKE